MNAGFALPPDRVKFEDCDFYHTVEIPDRGVVRGKFDLRQHVDEYLGGYRFAGKRVLEIGPASGFLTFEMERRGADVVALEVPDDPGWDFVPYPLDVLQPIFGPRRQHMTRIKNSFWFLHHLNGSKARLCYGDSCRIPNAFGNFDVAVMAAVLLHCERPVQVIAECAKRADTLIVTELYSPKLEGYPVCSLVPGLTNKVWDTWWHFSTDFFRQYFAVLGFRHTSIQRHTQFYEVSGKSVPFFTAIGSKSDLSWADKIEQVSGAFVRKGGFAIKQLPRTLINGVLRPFNLEIRQRQCHHGSKPPRHF
jgi:SAM-dependent methyltransferase